MPYILTSDNCQGRHFNFIVENGEYLQQGIGKECNGTLALQTFNNRNYRRLTFADAKNVYSATAKKLFGIASGIAKANNALEKGKNFGAYRGFSRAYDAANEDALCHFDFSEDDLRLGKKKIKYWKQFCGLWYTSAIVCYDFSDHTGCAYIFSDDDDAEAFARAIGIKEVEYLDFDGKLERVSVLGGDSESASSSKGQANDGPSIDSDLCLCCGTCADVCPVDAISMGDASFVIDPSSCIICGVCTSCCPIDAIK